MIPRYSSVCSLRGVFHSGSNRDFEELIGAKHVFFFSSCRGGMVYALRACGIGEGDEVILPSFICNVVPYALARFGIKPVFVDVHSDSVNLGNISVDGIEDKITERTRAIIPVHLYGNPYDSGRLNRLARRHGLFVIEDAAQALGAEYRGTAVGSLGDASCFSFGVGKSLSTGGGCIATRSREISERIRDIMAGVEKTGSFGDLRFIVSLKSRKLLMDKRIYGITHGVWRMFGRKTEGISRDDFKAGSGLNERLLRFQIKTFNHVLDTRRQQFRALTDALSGIRGITLPSERRGVKHSALWFSFYHRSFSGAKRDALLNRIRRRGIDLGIMYPFVSPEFYKERGVDYPNAHMLSRSVISLQLGPHLNESDISRISSAVKGGLNEG